jgi:hypothetical protein
VLSRSLRLVLADVRFGRLVTVADDADQVRAVDHWPWWSTGGRREGLPRSDQATLAAWAPARYRRAMIVAGGNVQVPELDADAADGL